VCVHWIPGDAEGVDTSIYDGIIGGETKEYYMWLRRPNRQLSLKQPIGVGTDGSGFLFFLSFIFFLFPY
jgi:hypothetical protein